MTIPGLPAGYSVRRPTLADGEAILAVVHPAERDALGRDDATLAEVHELLRLPRTPPETDHWLVEANGQAAAWGMVIDDHGGENVDLDVYSDPVHPEQVRQALLDLVLERVREHATQRRTGEVIVGAGVIVGDESYAAALRARGFVIERRFNQLRVELDRDGSSHRCPMVWRWTGLIPHPIPTGGTGMTSCRVLSSSTGATSRWTCRPSGSRSAPRTTWSSAAGASPWSTGPAQGSVRPAVGSQSTRVVGFATWVSCPPRGAVEPHGTCSSTCWLCTPQTADAGQGSPSTPRTSLAHCDSTNPPACVRGCKSTRSGGASTPMGKPITGPSVAAIFVAVIATGPTIVGVITEVVPFAPITEDCIDSDPDADPDNGTAVVVRGPRRRDVGRRLGRRSDRRVVSGAGRGSGDRGSTHLASAAIQRTARPTVVDPPPPTRWTPPRRRS